MHINSAVIACTNNCNYIIVNCNSDYKTIPRKLLCDYINEITFNVGHGLRWAVQKYIIPLKNIPTANIRLANEMSYCEKTDLSNIMFELNLVCAFSMSLGEFGYK